MENSLPSTATPLGSPSSWIRIGGWTDTSDKSWAKTLVLVGGTTVLLGLSSYYTFKWISHDNKRNGSKPLANGSAKRSSFIPRKNRTCVPDVCLTPRNPVDSRARLEMEFEEENVRRTSRVLFDDQRVSPSWTRRRVRSDSLTSGTTLLLTSRAPSELMVYGLESLKRTIRLFEETQTKMTIQDEDFGSVSRENSPDAELEFILSKSRQLADDVDSYLKEHFPSSVTDGNCLSFHKDATLDVEEDSMSLLRSKQDQFGSNFSLATTLTLPFFDIEPNLHFFKLYTLALDHFQEIQETRTDRAAQLRCDSHEEYLAKVHCLRDAFSELMMEPENCDYFRSIGQDILEMVLNHSMKDSSQCISAFDDMIAFVSNPDNLEGIKQEVADRNIPMVSFYDLVLDYVILESFDDLESPPSAVTSVANNRWLSSGFRELALQTAVSAVLKHKRGKLKVKGGFFQHFYNIIEHVSPVLAWGFLGSDGELKLKCNLIRDAILYLIRGYFSFDRVRYTSLHDLKEDILRITDDDYDLLRRQLSASEAAHDNSNLKTDY